MRNRWQFEDSNNHRTTRFINKRKLSGLRFNIRFASAETAGSFVLYLLQAEFCLVLNKDKILQRLMVSTIPYFSRMSGSNTHPDWFPLPETPLLSLFSLLVRFIDFLFRLYALGVGAADGASIVAVLDTKVRV